MNINHPTLGICGLSCRLCPSYQTGAPSRCLGCKSEPRMAVSCPFISCAINKKGIEFCWECDENESCANWHKHRDHGKAKDSFKCYQTLEQDIELILKQGVDKFEQAQLTRERLLKQMLGKFNEGRSKSYYCIATTVMTIDDLEQSLKQAKQNSSGLDIKAKAKLMRAILDDIAQKKSYLIKLRK